MDVHKYNFILEHITILGILILKYCIQMKLLGKY